MAGSVAGIYIAAQAAAPLESRATALAIAGAGLEGDRYAAGTGFYSPNPTTPGARELTLIEQETIDDIRAGTGWAIADEDIRRNVVTTGVSLPPLLGRRFTIGPVICEGVRPCPPCVHLEELTGKRLMPMLVQTGGLRARIVSGGVISVGDPVEDIGPSQGPTHREEG